MTFDMLRGSLDIAALQAAYRQGTLTPVSLIEALYARMTEWPVHAAWIHRESREAVMTRAKELMNRGGPELPLYGVPFAVKDNIDVAGMPTTAGCPAFAYVADKSAPCVEQLIAAGALCLGKVNLDQFATGLVGTRSPYGRCHNVFDASVLSGGSSSGSAVVVASHQVSFALGTDTAGSGRVPAALNNLVGLKPTVGLLSSDGVVPACASLDCVSVFALCVDDARLVLQTMLGSEPLPALSLPRRFRFAVPTPLQFFGDVESSALFERCCAQLEALGGMRVPVDFSAFSALGDMLYGPTVVERQQAVGSFIEAHPEDVLPVTRAIIHTSKQFGAAELVSANKRIASLKAACLRALQGTDLMVTPTTPRPYSLADDAAEPRSVNDKLGIYTRFVNYLGMAGLAVPAGFRADGLPFGVTLLASAGCDSALWELGHRLHAVSEAGMGRARHAVPTLLPGTERTLDTQLAVVGAHMRGLALNQQLLELGARFVRVARTAAQYQLFVLPGTEPERPGLVRGNQGHAVEIEVWEMSFAALGELMTRVPAPLAIGTLMLDDGSQVKGFLCEAHATRDARDISALGGFRAYLAQK